MRFNVFLVFVLALVVCMVQGYNTPDSCDEETCIRTCQVEAALEGNNNSSIGHCVSRTRCECAYLDQSEGKV